MDCGKKEIHILIKLAIEWALEISFGVSCFISFTPTNILFTKIINNKIIKIIKNKNK